MSDTQIVVAPRQSRRVALAAAGGLVVGALLGYGVAQVTGGTSPVPAVAAARPASAPQARLSPPADGAANVPAHTTPPVSAPPAPPAPAPAQAPAAVAAAPHAPGSDSISVRTAAGRELISAGSGSRYAVQLMVTDARERAYLESYLVEASRVVEPERLFLVPSGTPQSPRVGVLFGGFEARAQAADALARLPDSLRQFKPYVRSIESVRDEARRAQGS